MARVCHKFSTTGYCRFGSSCRYSHDPPSEEEVLPEEVRQSLTVCVLDPRWREVSFTIQAASGALLVQDLLDTYPLTDSYCGLPLKQHWLSLLEPNGEPLLLLDAAATLRDSGVKDGSELALVFPTLCVFRAPCVPRAR